MIQILKILWNKYRALDWWKQVILALPLLIAVILVCFFMFWKPSNDGERFENSVDYTREQVNAHIADKTREDKELARQDKELADRQRVLEEEIEDYEKKATNVVDDINRAAANNDLDQLRRIHRQLNASRNIQDKNNH